MPAFDPSFVCLHPSRREVVFLPPQIRLQCSVCPLHCEPSDSLLPEMVSVRYWVTEEAFRNLAVPERVTVLPRKEWAGTHPGIREALSEVGAA